MASRVVEIVADSHVEARKQLRAQLTEGLVLLRELSVGAVFKHTEWGSAATVEQAFAEAEAKVLLNSIILERVVRSEPVTTLEVVTEYDRESAEQKLGLKYNQTLFSLRVKKQGRKGMFGFFKTPSVYEAEVVTFAEVAVTYQTRCKVVFEIGSAEDYFAVVESQNGGSEEAIKALYKDASPRAIQALMRFVAKYLDLSRADAWIRKNRSLAIRSLVRLGHPVPITSRILKTCCTAEQYKALTMEEKLCLSDDLLEIIETEFGGKPFGYSSFPDLQFDKVVFSTIFIDLKRRGGLTNAGLEQFMLKRD